MRRRVLARTLSAAALVLAACGRGSREPQPAPAPVAAAPDTAAARRAAEARADSIRRDSVRADSVRRDSLQRDSVRLAERPAPPAPPGPRGRPRQERRCQLEFPNTLETRAKAVRDPSTGRSNTFVGGGVVARCVGQDVTLYADSAELYDTIKLYYLFGNVRYREARVSIDADRVTYFLNEERILAESNVRASLPGGSSMAGPQAEYFRPVAPVRTVSMLVATLRPTFTLVQRDSTGKPGEPATLLADRVRVVGDTLYYAGGNVDITRPDLHATSDSAFMDEVKQYGRLLIRPQVEGRGERKFVLRGRSIDFFSRDRLVERVLAVDSAQAVSGDLDLRSDTIDLRVTDNKLSRAYAWGPTRARAVSPDRTIIADSLDVQMPNQRVREVHAVRQAYAETLPDTTKLTSTERDWLRGDTIVAAFDSAAPPDSAAAADTSSRPRIRELVANGNASSYYQIPSNKGPSEPPSVNYVRGRIITVSFENQEVQSVVVEDQAAGVFLEPSTDTTRARQRTQPAAPPGGPGQPRPPAVRPPSPISRP
jgi:outer membrane lipopolysaccharide assembly protein LptE/RlpB